MVLGGLWHGAGWTFIFWGGFHALAFIPVFLMGRNAIYKDSVVAENTVLPSLTEIGQVFLTFAIVTFSRIFFRSNSITDAFGYISHIFNDLSYSAYNHPMGYRMMDYYILIILFIIYEWMIRKDERARFKFKSKVLRFIIYIIIILSMLLFYDSSADRSFIYFQF